MYKTKTAHIEAKPNRRILVTSDVHGHTQHLTSVLETANFSADDLLIIVGDIIEKGPDSLNTLRYVMKLCREGRAIALMGNVDLWRLDVTETLQDKPDNITSYLDYLRGMRKWKGTCLFDEMCRQLGITVETESELHEALPLVLERYSTEFDFLRSLPTALEADKYIFVHGGLPRTELADDLTAENIGNPYNVLKYDRFLPTAREKGQCFSRYIVSGHYPVTLYAENIPSANPIVDKATHTISIDGGCGLKNDGQLNLLIFPTIDCDPDDITYIYYDGFPTVTAKTAQEGSTDSINVRWGDNEVRFLSISGDIAEIEHIRTSHRLYVPVDYLYADVSSLSAGDIIRVNDCTDYLLPVRAGDRISVIRRTSHGILAKKGGVSGWYMGEIES
ncbi:MAG: metallophosphoesterase [Clostridia bacterium]|nr:metallophosphoesterase [Clostridia bacterium]